MYINNLLIISMVLLISSCNNTNQLNERILLENKTEAFQFLSTYHHQLHIMIGEEEGDGELAYKEFLKALSAPRKSSSPNSAMPIQI